MVSRGGLIVVVYPLKTLAAEQVEQLNLLLGWRLKLVDGTKRPTAYLLGAPRADDLHVGLAARAPPTAPAHPSTR